MHAATRRLTAVLVAMLLIAPWTAAADWPRWLGPDQNGRSPEKDVFGQQSPSLTVKWSRPLGIAYSAIALADGKAVTMFGDGEADWIVAMDAATGEEVWRYRIADMFPKVGGADGGPLSMPIVDDGVVYGLGAKGHLVALRLNDGSKIWSLRIDKKLSARQPYFGFTTAPLIVGDRLFVATGGGEGHSFTALKKKSGESLWSVGDEPVGYQSPVLAKLAGQQQIVAATNKSVSGMLAEDGTVLWRIEHKLNERDGWSTPILISDDAFLLTARNESAAYRVSKAGDGYTVEELWRGSNLKGNFAMPVVHKGRIYGYNGDFLTCLEAMNGEQLWKARSEAAGLILVDGHLVVFNSDGTVVVAEASAKGFEVKARVQVAEEGGFTFPSFADGAIYVRNLKQIARVDVGARAR